MHILFQDKLSLSPAAMKVVANEIGDALERGVSPAVAALPALRAGLGSDRAVTARFALEGPLDQLRLAERLVLVCGSSGSGKTEISLAMLKGAIADGFDALIVTSERHADAGDVLDLSAPDLDVTEIASLISAWLEKGEGDGLRAILHPSPYIRTSRRDEVLAAIIKALNRPGWRGMLAIDEFLHHHDLAAHREGLEAILRDCPEAVMVVCSQGDLTDWAPIPRAEILMRGVSDPDRQTLREREFVIRCRAGGARMRAADRRDWPGDNQAFLRAVKWLSSCPKAQLNSHMGRLEQVARACGYRSWHAAEGRR